MLRALVSHALLRLVTTAELRAPIVHLYLYDSPGMCAGLCTRDRKVL